MKHSQTRLHKGKLFDASERTEDVKGAFKDGLRAVKGEERSKFQANDTRLFTGSIDVDAATEQRYPHDNRWDYAIEYDNETFFVEVHPASTSEVDTMIAKLSWLKQWLKGEAHEIDALKAKSSNPFIWIFTKNNRILSNSPQARKLAQKGLKPIAVWKP